MQTGQHVKKYTMILLIYVIFQPYMIDICFIKTQRHIEPRFIHSYINRYQRNRHIMRFSIVEKRFQRISNIHLLFIATAGEDSVNCNRVSFFLTNGNFRTSFAQLFKPTIWKNGMHVLPATITREEILLTSFLVLDTISIISN